MTNPLEAHAWEHRRLSHENGTKVIYFSQADCDWIIAFKEGRLSNSQPPPSDSQRLRRGAGAGVRRRVPVLVPPTPVVQEPEYKFSKKVLNKLAVKKDINGNSVLVRVITRRKVESYKPVVPIERLFDTISMHHQHSVGYRGEKKLWNFLTTMAPTELAPDADGNPVFCFGLAGFERDGLTEKFLKECPVRADQAPRKKDEKPAVKPIVMKGPFTQMQVDLVDLGEGRDPRFRYVLVVVELYTRFVWIYPLPTKHALLVARHLYRLWCGIPRPATLQCDNGGEFKAAVASAAQLFNIRIINSSVGNPQAQGAVERTNRSFKDMLRALLLECPTIYWSFQLYRIADQINQQPCEAYNNEMSRYEALFGVRSMRTVHPPPELAASVLQLNSWDMTEGLELEDAPAPATGPVPQRRSRANQHGKKRGADEAELEPWATDSEAEEEQGGAAAALPSSSAGRRSSKRSRSNAGGHLAALVQQEQATDSEAEEEQGGAAAALPSSSAGRRRSKRSRTAAGAQTAPAADHEAADCEAAEREALEGLELAAAAAAVTDQQAQQGAAAAAGSSEQQAQQGAAAAAGSSGQQAQSEPTHMAAARGRAAAFLAKHQQKIANTRRPRGESKEFEIGQAVLLFPSDCGKNGSFTMVSHSIPCRVVRPCRNGQYQLQCNAGVLEGSYKRNDLRKANAAWEKKLAFTAAEVGNAETISLSGAVASMGGRMTDVRCGCRGKCSSNCPCKRARVLCGSHCKCCHGKKGANCGNSKALGAAAKRRKA